MKKTAKVLVNFAVLLLCAYILIFSAINGCSAISTVSTGGSFKEILAAASDDFFGVMREDSYKILLNIPSHNNYSAVEEKLCYNALLTDSQRNAYLEIENAVFHVTDVDCGEYGKNRTIAIDISGLGSMEIFMVKEAVLLDHPEVFWLNGLYSIHNNMHDGNYMYLYSDYSYADINLMAREMEQSVAACLRTIPRSLSEYERELLIHDYIVDLSTYDSGAADLLIDGASNYTAASTVYGVMVDGTAICGGYANTFKLLCNLVGISCELILGSVEDEGHMWNAVKLGGKWYYVDVTWDDPLYSGDTLPFDSASYDYFNVSQQQILFNHTISSYHPPLIGSNAELNDSNLYNFFIPSCTDESMTYYNQKALIISHFDRENRDALISAVLEYEPETKVYFRIPEDAALSTAEQWIKRDIIKYIQQKNPDYSVIAVPCWGDNSPEQCERVYFMYMYLK